MSFGSGGFGGFGQNNNQQSSGFGGFGSNNTTNTGFGTSNTNTAAGGFGSTANTGGLFGGGGGGFGSSTTGGGFGSNNAAGSTAFGAAKPTTFGSASTATGGGLFGSNNQQSASSSGFGGFGSNGANTSSGFGGSGGLFGNKTFGQTNTSTGTGSSLFGGASNAATTSGFSGGFGAANNPGIGANIGDPPGTNTTPFQAHTEKEAGGTSNQTNSFQNILFQDPYKKWSAEELRLADYNQGRRYGNASGTGAFGVSNFGSSGFGTGTQQTPAFGSNTNTSGGGLFGSTTNNTTSSGFGSTANTGGFGTNSASGSLFGNQNKPATGGLFGSNTNTSQPTQSGGLFGNTNSGTSFGAASNTTTSGFGNTASTGGGLFGAANAQNKPSGFSFGNNANTAGSGFGAASTGSAFGTNTSNTNNASGGGLFGNNATSAGGGGLFGNNNNQQQQNAGTSGFGSGSFSAQNQQSGTSLFGNQQKPTGGLFGTNANANTSGALFGNNTTTASGFGTNSNSSTGGGLFGQKPATTGTGLFGGGSNAAQSTNTGSGGGLFGGLGANAQTPQQNQGGLFSATQNQAKPGGLFGSSQQSGGGLFGTQTTQQPGSLFGNVGSQQQQPQQQGSLLGGSLLGASQSTNNLQQSLTASINDLSAYGNSSLFSNLGGNDMPNPGPLATPLSSKTKTRRSSILPMYKLNPASASRFVTPQKQRGFGFSYSTYGTPGTPSSTTSTPGSMGRSMLGSSLSRGLSKSVSSSSLRKSYSAEDSILAPGAFSASSTSRYYGNSGSVRKLVINKEMRSDLFSTPTKDKSSTEQANGSRKLSKRVSFDTSTVNSLENGTQGGDDSAAATTEAHQHESGHSDHGATASGSPDPALSAQGKELAIVHEEDAAQTPRASSEAVDKMPGDYWMSPTRDAYNMMNRVQRQSVENFTVGRDHVGYVRFRVPVDLTSIDLDDLFGGIVVLETRSATVYPNAAKKPPVGKGLNVPANICLEQSWPRGREKRPTGDSRRLGKHVERLKRIPDTTFVDYNQETGVWKFNVEHFTTYGLDYEEESDAEHQEESIQTAGALETVPSHPSPSLREVRSVVDDDDADFRRKRRALPGAFDLRGPDFVGEADVMSEIQGDSFLGSRFAGSVSNALVLSTEEEKASDDYEYDESEGGAAAGTPPGQHLAAKHQLKPLEEGPESPTARETPGGILRARMRAMKGSATPIRLQVADGDEWMDMLQKSVSPQKRDRVLLRSTRQDSSRGVQATNTTTSSRSVSDARGFATSIDLMHSLFEKSKTPANPGGAMGFVQWPYDRQQKSYGNPIMSDADQAYHMALKPAWGIDGTLILPKAMSQGVVRTLAPSKPDILQARTPTIPSGAHSGVSLFKFSIEPSAKAIANHIQLTKVDVYEGIPQATLHFQSLRDIFHDQDLNNPGHAHEKLVWDLASILFDNVPIEDQGAETRWRKDRLSKFWSDLVESGTSRSVALAKSPEGKALASLSGHRVQEACKALVEGRDFRLATLVSLAGAGTQARSDIRTQLTHWQDNNVLADFTDAVRALYEIIGGNVCVCEGKKSVPVGDRVESFVISRRFGFDWKQSFGMRLWYGMYGSDDLSEAVRSFDEDIAQDREDSPRTWYSEQGIDPLWRDNDFDNRQDLLWGLLRLYANIDIDAESVLRPENSQLSPLDSRLCWQLSRALKATGKVSDGQDSVKKADSATISFADQLSNEGNWLEATFILLHLTDPSARARAIKEHLSRHAADLGPETGSNFNTITQHWKIPESWLWEAQALYMRSVMLNPIAEVQCLLRAGSFIEAHQTLIRKVAPAAIVSRDYTGLGKLLSQFEGREDLISGWALGGDIYKSFLAVIMRRERREKVSGDVMEKLLNGLPAMRDAAEDGEISSIAAMAEMSNIVARMVVDATGHDQRDSPRVLGLPLTEDTHLQHSLHLSLSYYRGIMAGAI